MDAEGAAVGIVSLGIQLCQSWVRYYDDWKSFGDDIAETRRCVEALGNIFEALSLVVNANTFKQKHRVIVETCLLSCTSGLGSLKMNYDKFENQKKLKRQALRLLYAFKTSTLTMVKELVVEVVLELQLALQLTDISENITLHGKSLDAIRALHSDLNTLATNVQGVPGLVNFINDFILIATDTQATVARIDQLLITT